MTAKVFECPFSVAVYDAEGNPWQGHAPCESKTVETRPDDNRFWLKVDFAVRKDGPGPSLIEIRLCNRSIIRLPLPETIQKKNTNLGLDCPFTLNETN